jgi:endonuclease YncB( thermonuclease family)
MPTRQPSAAQTSSDQGDPASYTQLLTEIQQELERGFQAVERLRLQTYWNIGKRIHRYLGAGTEDHSASIRRLSADLMTSYVQLYRMLKFYQAFPELPADPPFSWSQYRELALTPDACRPELLARVRAEHLSGQAIARAAAEFRRQEDETELPPPDGGPLSCSRGTLFLYRISRVEKIADTRLTAVMIDCGFQIERKLILTAADPDFRAGMAAMSHKDGPEYILAEPHAYRADQFYTYAVDILKVIDGDTLDVAIDCGFLIRFRGKLRLRGINTPELSCRQGQTARAFVQERLDHARSVVIKTWRQEKYGRYLADIFYHPDTDDHQRCAQEGIFLNQQLLDEGLAHLY